MKRNKRAEGKRVQEGGRKTKKSERGKTELTEKRPERNGKRDQRDDDGREREREREEEKGRQTVRE